MIDQFIGPHRFLSNFYDATVTMYGEEYRSVEHAYMAAKCRYPDDRAAIRLAPTAADAKKRGRMVRLRPDWDSFRLTAMEELLRRKFAHPELRAQLEATRPHELAEGNWWGDHFWGICKGSGENHLGRLLMIIRDEPCKHCGGVNGYHACDAKERGEEL